MVIFIVVCLSIIFLAMWCQYREYVNNKKGEFDPSSLEQKLAVYNYDGVHRADITRLDATVISFNDLRSSLGYEEVD